ncbi:MAG: DUF3703 domain-containing protein [Acidimicrobiia bacterium]
MIVVSHHRTIPRLVSERLCDDLRAAATAAIAGETNTAWRLLEEAHVLSQPWAWPHVKVHAVMLRLGWRTRDRREVTGQMVRMVVAGPGSLTGRYPEGNTGRARVSATQPMPVPHELRALLDQRHG